MQHDAFFFIGIFVFIFLIWAATGGPTHPLAWSGPTLSQPGALGGGSYLSLPSSPFAIGVSNISLENPSSGSSGSTAVAPLAGVSFGPPSSYRGVVTLGGYVSGANSTAADESLRIHVSSDASAPVDISGWTIESAATGNASIIPQGTQIPMSGIIGAAQDVVIAPGDTAYLISGSSPIGASFQENKCVGYFSQFQKFSPPLPVTCPDPSTELSSKYGPDYIRDGRCIDYVNTLSRCHAVLSPPVTVSTLCQNFLTTYLNYNGCIQAHRSDADFLDDTWRVYLGRTAPMWRSRHEEVKLLDREGKTVDAFTY